MESPTPPRPLAVQVVGLTKVFDQHVALQALDLQVPEGEFYGFLGPNGAGKSTTIKILCGLLRPTSGFAQVLGRDVERDPLEVKRRIGVLPEEPTLYERLTPLEHLRFVGRLHGLPWDEIDRRSRSLLDLMEIAEADRRRLVVDFSMGMRKKVALACALVHGPRLLFLDEPFNGIDTVTVRAIRQLLQHAVANGVTIFFSSHVLELVERLCTRYGIIVGGVLRVEGTLEEIRQRSGFSNDASLEDVFVALVGGDRRTVGGLEFLA